MAKELTPIEVETLPNGYGLKVHGKKFLYFDETELFEGLIYHAGMAIMKETDKDIISDVIANLLAGETKRIMDRNQEQQNEMVKLEAKNAKLKAENEKLEGKIKRLEKKLSK